jgi:hypothetical protein
MCPTNSRKTNFDGSGDGLNLKRSRGGGMLGGE